MQTLYRKYRPQLWKEVFGQDTVKSILTNQILTGKISHAYIFAGSRGIGKTTVARLFAKTLNCKNRKEGEMEPCNNCDSCKAIDNCSDMSIIEIDAASYTGVDNVRELRNIAKVPSSAGVYKVFIIDEVHMLSKAAFNALLKILEEPPERVVFILATTEINKILDTILSRCQIFKFKKANKSEILEDLNLICEREGIEVDKKLLDNISERAFGGFRDAESLLGQIISSTNEKKITYDLGERLINMSNLDLVYEFSINLIENKIKENLNLIEKIKELEISFPDFILDLIEFFRKILVYKYNNDVIENWLNLGQEIKDEIKKLSMDLNHEKLNFIIRKLMDAKIDIEKSDIIELPLELTIIEIGEKEVPSSQYQVPSSQLREEKKEEKKVEDNMNFDEMFQGTEKDIKKVDDVIDEKNNLLKNERLLAKFGIKKGKDFFKNDNIEEIKEIQKDIPNIEEKKEEPIDNGVSVLDLLKEEFKDEIIS